MGLTPQDIEELRLGAITAIDGLWFLAAENKLGFEEALELDLEVWRNYGLVMAKRLSRRLGIDLGEGQAADLATVRAIMEGICEIDGTEAAGEIKGGQIVFTVDRCSWWENLSRSGRTKIIPCEDIDNKIFGHWLKRLDPELGLQIIRSRARGDDHCTWIISRKGS